MLDHKIIRVAFILHPLNVSEFNEKAFFYLPFDKILSFILQKTSPRVVKKLFAKLPPHIFLNVDNFTSLLNKRISIIGVMCGLFPEELINENKAFEKVLKAVRFALKKEAKIIILTGFTSIVGNEGEEIRRIFKNKDIIITSGNAFTAALSIRGIIKAAEVFKKDIQESTISIIGATGDIGGICSIVLAKKFKNIILCSREINERNKIVQETYKFTKNLIVEPNIQNAVKNADFVLLATSSYLPLIDPKDIKPHSIICDTSLPHNIHDNFIFERKDVFVFDGGIAKIEVDYKDKKWNKFAKNNTVYGCIAEGMILGFARLFTNFSIGRGNITEKDIEQITYLGELHGLRLADFSFHNKIYTMEEIEQYRQQFTVNHR